MLIEHFVAVKASQEAQAVASAKQPEVTATLQVPERFVGSVIGKKGEIIKLVRETFNVAIWLDKDRISNRWYRNFNMKGSERDVVSTKHEVERTILRLYRSIGIFNAPLEEKYANDAAQPPPPPEPPPQGQERVLPMVAAGEQQ